MKATIIQKDYPEASPLEAKAKLLTELLANKAQVDAHMRSFEQASTDIEKSNVLDFLGAEDDIRAANNTIVSSLTVTLTQTTEQELEDMRLNGHLVFEDKQWLSEIKRLNQLDELTQQNKSNSNERDR